jgi:hypothetical protein
MKENELLLVISEKLKSFDFLYKETGAYFNIFDITGFNTKEVVMCRILHSLLDPKGSHYQESLYLHLFFEHVIKIPDFKDNLSRAYVNKEEVIEDARRIDLVIVTEKYYIPIEVKIGASDQPNQCTDYISATPKGKECKMLYLTKNGDPPTGESTRGMTQTEIDNKIANISWHTDILGWIDLCIAQKETVKAAPIREVLLQFGDAIRSFTNQNTEDVEMELNATITANAENLKSAVAISKALLSIKHNCVNDIFQDIKDHIDDVDILQFAKEKMRSVKNGEPAISYWLPKITGVDKNIGLVFEYEEKIDNSSIWWGFNSLDENGGRVKSDKTKDTTMLKELYDFPKHNGDPYAWTYCISNIDDGEMYDAEGYAKKMKDVFANIDKFINKVQGLAE